MSLGFLIRGVVSEPRLFDAVARALAVPVEEVARFDGVRDATVLVEIIEHTAGFLTDVTLYFDKERVPWVTESQEIDIARSVARDLGDEVLVGPPADDPVYAQASYTWYLITPDGKRFVADEIKLDETSDDIEINRATLRPVWER